MLDNIIAKLALIAASMGAGTASVWNNYQPKEPKNIK